MFEEFFTDNKNLLNQWFEQQYDGLTAPIYNSFDIRVSRDKIAPVDANFFPAAFNKLPLEDEEMLVDALKDYLDSLEYQNIKILLVPENLINIIEYNSHLMRLKTLFEKAKRQVEIGTVKQPAKGSVVIRDLKENAIILNPLRFRDGILRTMSGFFPDVIVMNNDMRKQPELIKKAKQPILPKLKIGWWFREKANFFYIYNNLVKKFSEDLNFNYEKLDIKTELFVIDSNIVSNIENFFLNLKMLYKQRIYKNEPYVIIKPYKGTYGKDIKKITTEADIEKIVNYYNNRRYEKVIVQEGIKTNLDFDTKPCEPVVYTIGKKVVSGFWRYNKSLDFMGNLNCKDSEYNQQKINDEIKLVAQLANLAATIELNEV